MTYLPHVDCLRPSRDELLFLLVFWSLLHDKVLKNGCGVNSSWQLFLRRLQCEIVVNLYSVGDFALVGFRTTESRLQYNVTDEISF